MERQHKKGLKIERKIGWEELEKIIASEVVMHAFSDERTKACQNLLLLLFIILSYSSMNNNEGKKERESNPFTHRIEFGGRRKIEEGLNVGLVGRAEAGSPSLPEGG